MIHFIYMILYITKIYLLSCNHLKIMLQTICGILTPYRIYVTPTEDLTLKKKNPSNFLKKENRDETI